LASILDFLNEKIKEEEIEMKKSFSSSVS